MSFSTVSTRNCRLSQIKSHPPTKRETRKTPELHLRSTSLTRMVPTFVRKAHRCSKNIKVNMAQLRNNGRPCSAIQSPSSLLRGAACLCCTYAYVFLQWDQKSTNTQKLRMMRTRHPISRGARTRQLESGAKGRFRVSREQSTCPVLKRLLYTFSHLELSEKTVTLPPKYLYYLLQITNSMYNDVPPKRRARGRNKLVGFLRCPASSDPCLDAFAGFSCPGASWRGTGSHASSFS